MTQEQLEALLAQMGALGPGDFREETKQEDIPNPAATANGGLDPNAPLTIKGPVTYRTWVKPGTNRRLTVKVNGDGTYTQAFSGADPEIKGPTTTARTPEKEADDKAAEAERAWNAANGPGGKGLPGGDPNDIGRGSGFRETHMERRTREAAEKKAADDKTNVDADNRRADQTAAQTAATSSQNAATAAAREKREQEAAGRIQDPTTKQWLEKGPDGTWRPIKTEGVPSGAEPAGSPKPSGRLGEAAADLRSYDEWLGPQVRAGKMTPEQADKLREARRSFWQTALDEQKGVVNAQQSAYNAQNTQRATTLSDLSNRRSSAATIATSDPNGLTGLATKLGGGAAPAAGLSEAIRNSRIDAQNFVTMSGANRQVPEIQMGPAMQTVNSMGLPYGASTMPSLNVRPNAIGAGAVPGAVTPGGAQVAAQTQQVTGDTQRAITPLLTPSAPATAPVAQQATPAAATPVQAAPAQAVPAQTAQPSSGGIYHITNPTTGGTIVFTPDGKVHEINAAGSSSEIGTWNPASGQPPGTTSGAGDAPAASPVAAPAAATPSTDTADLFAPKPQPSQYGGAGDAQSSMAPTQAPPYFLAGSSRGHTPDPTPSIQEMIDDPYMDNNAVRTAVAEMFPGYPIDQLLQGRAA